MKIAKGEIELRNRNALLSRFAIPPRGFRCVLRDAEAVQVHRPYVVLGAGVALFRRKAIPLQGLNEVLCGEFVTNPVNVSKPGLNTSVSRLGGIDQRLSLANRV